MNSTTDPSGGSVGSSGAKRLRLETRKKKLGMKVRPNSIESTADSVDNRRCGILKRVVLPSPQQHAIDGTERDASRITYYLS
jgi:hypothetical protein